MLTGLDQRQRNRMSTNTQKTIAFKNSRLRRMTSHLRNLIRTTRTSNRVKTW